MTTDRGSEVTITRAGTDTEARDGDPLRQEQQTIDCTPLPNADIILVGGGSSSADIIPHLCRTLRGRVRGVLFIDHDEDEFHPFRKEVEEGMRVPVSVTHLEKEGARFRREFEGHVRQLGMDPSVVNWDAEIHDRPAMIRNHVWLRRERIFDAVWTYIEQMGDLRARIVFVFGMTGMTSATVALEAAACIRDLTLNRWYPDGDDRAPVLDDRALPNQIGIGLFPPDPTLGAADYNIRHGLNVAKVIASKLGKREPDPNPKRSNPLRNSVFDSYTCLDASADPRKHMGIEDFDDWVARTLALTFTGLASSGHRIADRNEILDDLGNFTNLSLVMAGVDTGRDQNQVKQIKNIAPAVEEVLGTLQEVRDEFDREPDQIAPHEVQAAVPSIPDSFHEVLETVEEIAKSQKTSTFLEKLGAIRTAEAELEEAAKELSEAGNEITRAREERGKSARSSRSFSLGPPVLLTILPALVGGGVGGFITSSIEGAVIWGAALGAAGMVVGILISMILARSRYNKRAAAARDAEQESLGVFWEAARRLRYRIEGLEVAIKDARLEQRAINALHEEWHERPGSRLWVMPQADNWIKKFNDASLPLSTSDSAYENQVQVERDAERQEMSEGVETLLTHAISPVISMAEAPPGVTKLTVRIGAPAQAVADFGFDKGNEDVRALFDSNFGYVDETKGTRTDWTGEVGQKLPDDNPCYFLMHWDYKDEKHTPRFYKTEGGRRIRVDTLPADRNAWPDVPASAVDEANKILRQRSD